MSGKRGMGIRQSKRTTRDPAVIYAELSEARVDLADLTLKIEYLSAELGRALSEARRSRHMSQESVGALVGITRDMVCLLEIGRRGKRDAPYIEQLVQLLGR